MQRGPDDLNLLYTRAMLAEKRDDLPQMEKDLRAIIAREPENAMALNALGYTLADPYNQLPAIVYWLMGSLAMANLDDLARLGPPMLLAMLAMCLCGRGLDALSMGDDEARSLGVPVRALRYGVIALATLASALTCRCSCAAAPPSPKANSPSR